MENYLPNSSENTKIFPYANYVYINTFLDILIGQEEKNDDHH
jgi:hypothetical protein